MKTRITELLGIEYPVVQGAMARIADGGLAGAVSEAGGLGIIACGGARPEWIREQVARARALTSKPIGINVMLMDPRAGEVAELVCELGVEVVTTGAGSPANYMKMWKEAGVKVVPVVASSALAARMERLGADAVVAEGTEAGGHIGELTTMALVPSVCAAVSIPSSPPAASWTAGACLPPSRWAPRACSAARASSRWRSAACTRRGRRRC